MNPTDIKLNPDQQKIIDAGNVAGQDASKITGIAYTNLPTTINSSNTQPATPYNLPSTTPSTSTAGLLGASDSSLQNFIDNKTTVDKTNAAQAKNDLTQTFNDITGVYSNPDVAKATEKVSQSETLNNDAFNALQASKRAQEKELKALVGSGLGEVQIQQRSNEINRRYAFDQADLSIALDVSNRNYTAAQNTANNLINSKLEPLKLKLDFQKTFYEDYKDTLSRDEQNQLQNLITQNDRQYKQIYEQEKTLQDTKLSTLKNAQEAGAPSSVINAISLAKTPEEVLTAAGRYGGGLDVQLKQAQLAQAKVNLSKSYSDNQVLSISDAKALGVPYGTTKGQAIALGKVPGGGGQDGTVQLAEGKATVDQLSALAGNQFSGSAVGTSPITRATTGFWKTLGSIVSVVGIPERIKSGFDKLTGTQQEFISGVEQMRSKLNLQALIDAKSKGATFGALSDNEGRLLASSASKIGTWAIKDKDGNIIGYNTSQTNFKKELDKINNFAKLDYIVRGGDPADVGAKIMPDGSVWASNSDGTFTQIK